MLFTPSKSRRRRSGFAVSALLHALAFCALVLLPDAGEQVSPEAKPAHTYSVLVLHLQKNQVPVKRKLDEPAPPRESVIADRGSMPGASGDSAGAAAIESSGSAAPEPTADPAAAETLVRRQTVPFVLPPIPNRKPAPQTLVQPDVPPDVQLAHEIPLPTLLVWQRMPAIRRNFVAPPSRPSRPQPRPEIPDISPPVIQPSAGDMKTAAVLPTTKALLFVKPASTIAVKTATSPTVLEPPQLGIGESADSKLGALISLSSANVITGPSVAIPPANQLAASGKRGAGGSGESRGTAQNNGSSQSASGSGSGGGSGSGAGGSGSASTAGSGSLTARNGSVVQSGGFGGGIGNEGFNGGGHTAGTLGSAAAGPGNGDDTGQYLPLAGMTRLTQPKEGKYGLIVSGSSLSAPYVESVGALSGKIVYSVYVAVGLQKKWILQYCLPRAEEEKTLVNGLARPIDPPWPYVIVRPEAMGTPTRDYILVHGIVTAAGRFEQLGFISPVDRGKGDLLMAALKQWSFRPAARDGVPADVEVLLIIPTPQAL